MNLDSRSFTSVSYCSQAILPEALSRVCFVTINILLVLYQIVKKFHMEI
ncbi:hypothetical protein CLOSYM_03571 [[Clostridium] symbiosum ATCC 14940]|uniref:Uncharacterized protein n=1 Tax=[Clostridium] symbiosum ATCC 14940 TaxID=411472 RepID=A0ABC9TU85_CLOSY|nr:hypothetical protein CLOSYM_03571 [[Clostridium] symbiosum ATCC 14940]